MKLINVFSLIIIVFSCRKEDKICPLQNYNIECNERSLDWVFGGYLTGRQQYTVQSRCPEDAQKVAREMSYSFGDLYRTCRVIP